MSRSAIHLIVCTMGLTGLLWAMDDRVEHRGEVPAVEAVVEPSGDDALPLPKPAFARLEPEHYLGEVVAVQFSPDGRYLAAGVKRPNRDYKWPAPEGVCIWDVKSRKFLQYIDNLEPRLFAFSPDSTALAATRNISRSGNDPSTDRLFLFDLATGIPRRHYDFPWRFAFMKFSEDGARIFYKLSDRGFRPCVLDINAGTVSEAPVLYVPDWNRRLSPDGQTLAAADQSPLKCYRLATGQLFSVPATSKVEDCQFSPDSRYIAYLDEHGEHVHFLDIQAGKFASSFYCPDDYLKCVAFAADGRTFAAGVHYGSILLWNVGGKNAPRFTHASEKEALGGKGTDPERRWNRAGPGPANAKVILKTKKTRYVFGEEIFIDFELHNVGRRPFSFTTGGDYRGATRHLNFNVEAIHSSGEEAPDPQPNQMCMGGIMGGHEIVPGEKYSERLDLLAYRRLDRPGTYRISASHGRPVGETTIELAEPTLAEAKKLLEGLDGAQYANEKPSQSTLLAYGRLTHPIYLPLLAERARKGSVGALESLGQMPNPEATKVLIKLLDSPNPKFVAEVEQQLYYRLPDPELEGKLHRRGFFDSDGSDPRKYLRDKSWRPEFAAAVRAHARRCLAKKDDANLYRGAFMLACVGTAEDLPAILAGFDVAVAQAQGKPIPKEQYPRAPYVCAEIRRAVQMMLDRGAEVPAVPKKAGEKLLFVEAISRHDDFRPKNWEHVFVGILHDRFDYLREVAVNCAPEWCPKSIRDTIPELLRDPHIDVQIAAMHLLRNNPQPERKPVVIDAFLKSQEQWQLRAADGALYHHCSRLERIEAHIEKMGDSNAKMASDSVEMLDHTIFRDCSGGSNGINLDTPAKRKACQDAWRKFVAANRDKLERRVRFSLLDNIPTKDLFPGYEFSMPRSRRGSDFEWSD